MMNPTRKDVDILASLHDIASDEFVSCKKCDPYYQYDVLHLDWLDYYSKYYNITHPEKITNDNICRLCFVETSNIVEHRISYFPEIIEFVCKSCHALVKWNDVFIGSWVQYTLQDYHNFYKKHT